MEDFLTFRRMISPILIQIVYWVMTAVAIFGGGALLVRRSYEEKLAGVLLIILGLLVIRVYTELIILGFRMNETLTEIKNNTQASRGFRTSSPGDGPPRVNINP